MENTKTITPKNVGGIVLDIITVGMLFASFAALFYSGFILKTSSFPLGAMCAITAVGLLLLFFIGDVSCLYSKAKNRSLTVGFLVFSALQLMALIVNLALLLSLMCRLFSVDQLGSRLAYVITASMILIGYVMSISYFSEGAVPPDAEDQAEEEDEGDFTDDEETEEEEESETVEEDSDDADAIFEVEEDADDASDETDDVSYEVDETFEEAQEEPENESDEDNEKKD